MKEFQKNLSLTLATATQSDSPGMQSWEDQLIRNGDKTLQLKDGVQSPRGFQIFSNLMRYGDYDDKFLKNYSNAVMQAERAGTSGGGPALKNSWPDMPVTRLNHTNSDRGFDPMAGLMRGLANSPDAATDFFHQPYEPAGDDGKSGRSNFDYLFKDRQWEMAGGSGDGVHGRNALGDALEAGATGHVAGEKPTSLIHDKAQADLMENVVEAVSEDPRRLTENLEMGDSVGRMAREYMPDIYRGLEDSEGESVAQLHPISGSVADFGGDGEAKRALTRFMVATGQDPAGYSEIIAGQKDYAESVLKYHLDPEVQARLPESQRFEANDPDRVEDLVGRITRDSGHVGGALTTGRQEALVEQGFDRDNAFRDANIRVGTWGYAAGATATGISLAVGGVNPVAGAAISGLTGGPLFVGPSEFGMSHVEDEAIKKAYESGKYWSSAQHQDIEFSEKLREKVDPNNKIEQGSWETWVNAGSKNGFNDASVTVHHVAPELSSLDQVPTQTGG